MSKGGGFDLTSGFGGKHDKSQALSNVEKYEKYDRESSRMVRKRSEHDFDGFERRKGFDRYRDGGGSESSRGYERNVMHRSESFCGSRREFPKGFRSERDRSRREGSESSWRRFGSGNKEFDEGGSRGRLEERGKRLRDVRSPTWSNSKDSGSEQSRVRSPPRGYRDRKSMSKSKSPTWSKDSVGSEQSKCVEVKKSEGIQVESGSRSSSEMEEGELEPEPEAEAEAEPKPKSVPEGEPKKEEVLGHVGLDVDSRVIESDKDMSTIGEDKDKSVYKEEMEEANKIGICHGKDVVDNVDNLPNHENNLANEKHGSGSDMETETCNEHREREKECLGVEDECEDEAAQEVVQEKLSVFEEESKQDKGINLEVKAEDVKERELRKELTEENAAPEEDMAKVTESLAQSFKDKGKSVAVTPTHVVDSVGVASWSEREPRDLLTCRDSDVEGPSTRGFELFSSSPVRRQEKADQSGANMQKDGKLVLEPLDLSLSLPNVLLPIGAAPGSPGQARSVQSLTNTIPSNSDGMTASVSFSGSQSFYHNPSCSLTQHSMDNFEQSVGSRPIFQGIDWQALSQSESKNNEVPRLFTNGNSSHQQSLPISNGQSGQTQLSRLPEGNSKIGNGLERQLSFHKQLPGGQSRHPDNVRSPSHSVGSHEIGSSYSFDRKRLMREKSSASLYRTSRSKMDQEQFLIGGAEFVETIIARVVSEPIHVMARKFHEMTGQSLACVKDSIREIMWNAEKRRQICFLQKELFDRPDITLEVLLKSHKTQLQILVALKTGLPDFLQQEMSVSSSDLAEIFLNLRCKNLACRSPLPVDECDCKVCAQKNGFCSSCMCLVCSKFDMASNTCSWVGCDVCLHWCHADCGLRESYIRNGRSATGAQGTSEMQFHCVACDHPSEMFGFVKEVFQNFAKDWTAETLSRELEHVKRIFAASKDLRGKRLYEIAGQMLTRLTNKSDLPEVYSYIMAFLNDADSFKLGNMSLPSGKEQTKGGNGIAGPSQEPTWLKSVYPEKVPQLEIPASLLPSYSYERNDKRIVDLELPTSTQNALFDELESIVRIKQAEAKMFQSRADDARREAEGLQRIAMAKNGKIEEEYASRIAKLRLAEAEQQRKQKFDELQCLDRAHREYFNMKKRMEAEIKDLLLKMEATKRNLAA
ncbi:Protein OBERON [Parasponia andersonii]|uniref:Protein OBERON n=1 Tax=Parasponia andersonii TaxID=3476 RepID=A0A2P5DLQ8_PARAD|nr:Protein OBERON [Parasponia andersonii]